MKIKITYILYGIDKALAFEWIINKINTEKFELEFISLYNKPSTQLEIFCKQNNIPFYKVNYQSKKDIPKAIYQTYKILKKSKTNIVNAHLFEAGIIGIMAAFLARIKKRIYTRHYATFHHQYHPNGVKYDKFINLFSTHIIAICNNVKNVLVKLENVSPKKIVTIHHGFDLNDFYSISDERKNTLQQKYNPNKNYPVIGVVSRYLELKGIQYIIPAFQNILKKYPNAMLVLANANGNYKNEIKKLLNNIPQKNYIEIDFENDNAALFKLFDIFIHVPINDSVEAFGQIYVEALACKIPSIFTLSGVAPEFIVHNKNALVVDFKNANQIENSIIEIIENKELKKQLIDNSNTNLDKFFSLNLMIQKLEKLYEQ